MSSNEFRMNRIRFWATRTVIFVMTMLSVACASQPEPTQGQINLEISASANPNRQGRPSPTAIRVYALRSPQRFLDVDLVDLERDPVSTLGATLIREAAAVTVAPKSQSTLAYELPAETKFVGIAAFLFDVQPSARCVVEASKLNRSIRRVTLYLGSEGWTDQFDDKRRRTPCRTATE